MLFFFGVRNSVIAAEPLSGLACANCQTPEALTGTVFSRYLHLFWIPVVAIGKSSVTACRHCKQVLTAREMPASYRAPVQALQQRARTPLTHFALLLLFGAVVAFGMVMSVFGTSKPTTPATGSAAAEAAVGNRYQFKLGGYGQQYGLAEVTKVAADTVYYRMTGALRAPLTAASATLALRDSVTRNNANQRASTQQWHYMTTGQGLFKQLE